MFSIEQNCPQVRHHRLMETQVIQQTEGTYWGFCAMFQRALNVYSLVLPQLGALLPAHTVLSTHIWNTFHLNQFSLHSFYNSILMGYYPTAGTLLRGLLESYVRMRYFEEEQDDNLVTLYYNDEPRFRRQHGVRAMFQAVAPSWYNEYKFLCGFSHGGLAPVLTLGDLRDGRMPTSVIFKEQSLRRLIDKAVPILLVHLKSLDHRTERALPPMVNRQTYDATYALLRRHSDNTGLQPMIEELVPV